MTFCTQTRSCHSGCCFDPENTKLITACSCPTSTVTLMQPDNSCKKVSLIITGLLLPIVPRGDVGQSLRRSPVPMMLMYAESGQIQQRAIARPSHSLLQPRRRKPFPILWKDEGKWVEDEVLRRGGWFERLFFGRCCPALRLSLIAEKREETMPIGDLSMQSKW